MIQWCYHLEAKWDDDENTKRLDYKRADYESMKIKLGEIEWEEVLRGDANQDWILFREKVLELEKQYVPIKEFRKKKKNIWMTKNAVEAVNKKRQIYSKYRQDSHPAVKKANARAKKAVKKAKKNFEKSSQQISKMTTNHFMHMSETEVDQRLDRVWSRTRWDGR